MFSFDKRETKILRKLNTPRKIQDFLNGLKINFEEDGETCMSPRRVIQIGKAHCVEGAMLAAAALRVNGFRPLVVDLAAAKKDLDHVVAVFRQHGCWGAISKTNHAMLRYREPVYKTIRELVMSYFHEYFTDDGKKTLRSYSLPVDLSLFDGLDWMTAEDDVWEIPEYLADVKHYEILDKKQILGLRDADRIEIEAGKILEFKK